MRRALLLLVAAALVLSGCSGAEGGGTDQQKVVRWLDERPDVASVQEQDDQVVVRLEEGRTDDQVWDFVDDFGAYAAPLHALSGFRIDVDGFAAYLPPVGRGSRSRSDAQGDLVRALWFRADGRATAVTDGASVSVSTLVTAPAADVAALALDLQALDVDTGDSIRVQSADGTMGVQWSTRLDFGVDVAALRAMVALQQRFPGTGGWINGVVGATRVGVVFSPRDISLDDLREQAARLVPWLDRDKDAVGWGTLVTSPRGLRDATKDPATRAAYVALAAVPGLAPARYVDVLATDLAGFRAARRVLAAHPRAGLRSLGYAPAPAPFLGQDRDLVVETSADETPSRLASYEKVMALPDVIGVVSHAGRLELAAGIDDEQLRSALAVMRELVPREATITVSLAASRTGVRRWVGSTELAPDGKVRRGEAADEERLDDDLLQRVETTWTELVG
ncbi:hypothetical protein [Nocardioides sp. LML1-1-1.1]|uniref:hypothetical protein n=1 Tax=Nocardioides sp. LML1-1-1.1 TaxID=3135248 RepID=UPI00343BB6C1